MSTWSPTKLMYFRSGESFQGSGRGTMTSSLKRLFCQVSEKAHSCDTLDIHPITCSRSVFHYLSISTASSIFLWTKSSASARGGCDGLCELGSHVSGLHSQKCSLLKANNLQADDIHVPDTKIKCSATYRWVCANGLFLCPQNQRRNVKKRVEWRTQSDRATLKFISRSAKFWACDNIARTGRRNPADA